MSRQHDAIRCITRRRSRSTWQRFWGALRWFLKTVFSGKGTSIGM